MRSRESREKLREVHYLDSSPVAGGGGGGAVVVVCGGGGGGGGMCECVSVCLCVRVCVCVRGGDMKVLNIMFFWSRCMVFSD